MRCARMVRVNLTGECRCGARAQCQVDNGPGWIGA